MKKYIIGFTTGVLLSSSVIAFAATTGSFPDVKSTAYYKDAVQTMAERGVITGYKNGNFGPEDTVTRGQTATMLSRYDKSLVTYHGKDNNIGNLIDVVCAKLTVDNTSKDTSLYDEYTALCTARSESENRD